MEVACDAQTSDMRVRAHDSRKFRRRNGAESPGAHEDGPRQAHQPRRGPEDVERGQALTDAVALSGSRAARNSLGERKSRGGRCPDGPWLLFVNPLPLNRPY